MGRSNLSVRRRFIAAATIAVCGGAGGLAACSSSNATSDTTPPVHDAAIADVRLEDARVADVVEAALIDVPEPPWDGQTIQPGCMEDGCIRSLSVIQNGAYSQADLQGVVAPSESVENGIVTYAISYMSDGTLITGTVVVPDSTPPSGGFAVVVMNQFTSGVAPACAPSQGLLAPAVSSPASLHGFVTLVPDATSYGPQPYGAYLVGPVAGRAALDGVRAAFHTSSVIGVPVARKAVIAGLSQGAFSTMAAAVQFPTYAPELEIRGFAAAEPPSHFATALQTSVAANNVAIPYDALRMWSWQHFLNLSGGQIFLAPYDTEAPNWFETQCVYQGSTGGSGTLDSDFPANASTVLSAEFLGYAKNNTWPKDWAAQNAASEQIPMGLKLPVVIYEGTDDTTVLPANTQAYVAELKAAGVNVDYRVEAGGTHGTTALSSFTVDQVADANAIAWIKQQLAN